MHLSEELCRRELDLEIADVLPHRDTLGIIPGIVVAPHITVAAVTGVAIATQVLTNRSTNVAAVITNLHI